MLVGDSNEERNVSLQQGQLVVALLDEFVVAARTVAGLLLSMSVSMVSSQQGIRLADKIDLLQTIRLACSRRQ